MRGYGIARWIFDRSGEEFRIEEGLFYPALHRRRLGGGSKRNGACARINGKAKFYRLTGARRRELAKRLTGWSRFMRAVDRILTAVPEGA